MCTLVVLRRPDHPWPVLLAANRDEMIARPWRAPGRHWPDRPEVVAGLDELAGGSWLGMNDHGVVAAVLNRRNSLGPDAEKRSRGELVLEALEHADALEAAQALSDLDGRAYRGFNMALLDNRDAYWLRGTGERIVGVLPLPEGISMLTAYDLNAKDSPRAQRFLPRFAEAPAPDPETEDWRAWEELLAETDYDPEAGPQGAMNVSTDFGFGTVSSSLIALPEIGSPHRPMFRFAAGRPNTVPYQDVRR